MFLEQFDEFDKFDPFDMSDKPGQTDRQQQETQKKQFYQDLRLLAEFLSLRCCRTVFLSALFLLATVTSIRWSHTPVSLYALLCYFFVYLILSEYTKKWETPEFSLFSLRLRYHYRYSKLLTERFSFWFSFFLLGALQYAFLYTIAWEQLVLTYIPSALALFLLLLRYLTTPFFRLHLKHLVMYRH